MDMNDFLNNPLAIQKKILEDYERNLGGELTVVDSNNAFNFLIETFSRTVAESTIATDTKLNSIYPRRATLTKELYHHLSDYDYVGFFSYPANLKMSIMLHRQFLLKNAVQAPGTNYKLVEIPANSIFQIGRFKFGLYYPIQIRINNVVDTISAAYDTTEINPLNILSTNNIQVRKSTYKGIELVQLEFDVFQFDKQVVVESIRPEIGFNKKYSFDDKFYAIRIFDTLKNKELSYTMSDSVYDPGKPTVKLKVYPENNELEVSIPQIYLTTNQISNQLRIELYSTQGELNASLVNIRLEDIQANFALDSNNSRFEYSKILKNIPTIILAPIDTRVVGGSNGYTFQQMKDFTVYRVGASTVPITRMEMERFFSQNGFKYLTKIDNLTDRRYYAYRQLLLNLIDLNVVNGSFTINANEEVFNSNVLYLNNNTIVIQPTALFQYVPSTSSFRILSDEIRNTLLTASPHQLATILNEQLYFCQPYHWVISKEDRYPNCMPYDLLSTTANAIVFEDENVHLSAQMSLITTIIKHLGEGSGGYVVRVGLQKSEDLLEIPAEDINVFLTVTTREGYTIGIRGIFVESYEGQDVYDFTISTNYKITNNRITITNLTRDDGILQEFEIDLTGKMRIATFVDKKHFEGVQQNHDIKNKLISTEDRWLSISLQSFEYKLGSNINDVLDSNLLTTWTGQDFERHPEDVYLTYERDVYETNPDGSLKTEIVLGELILNKLHSAGDQVLDIDTGLPVIKYTAGSFVTDVQGNPIPVASRTKDFTFEFFAFSYRHRIVTKDFLILLANEINSYFNTIRTMDQQVLENTQIFFRPITTSGSGSFKLNNIQRISIPLEMSWEFNIFVSQAIIDNPDILAMIESQSIEILKKHHSNKMISIVNITTEIQQILSDYVNSIDFVSLNGDHNIQTLMLTETDKVARLAYELTVTPDLRIESKPKLKINFSAFDI